MHYTFKGLRSCTYQGRACTVLSAMKAILAYMKKRRGKLRR